MEAIKYKNRKIDGIEVTSRLMNIILEMPLEQQLDLLDSLDENGTSGARRYTRTYLKRPWVVSVDANKQSDHYLIKDIGRCGMFIETKSTFDVGEKISMKFQMPSSEKIFRIMGQVVRYQNNGIGVKFLRQLSVA